MNKNLRSGYTTGACSAAGVKAALFFFRGERVDSVEIHALDGTLLNIPIEKISEVDDGILVEVKKFSGDDPDITNGVSIFIKIRRLEKNSGIVFKAGLGIGIVTKSGLQIPVGEPAINPKPRELIRRVADEFDESDLEITISIPEGIELAKKTLNPTLGIVGGLSILGTTGVLRPMSEDAFKNSLVPQISIALAAGFKTQIFCLVSTNIIVVMKSTILKGNAMNLLPSPIQRFSASNSSWFVIITSTSDKTHWHHRQHQ